MIKVEIEFSIYFQCEARSAKHIAMYCTSLLLSYIPLVYAEKRILKAYITTQKL